MKSSSVVMAALAAALAATPALAGALENMERERAVLIQAFLDPELKPNEREARLETAKRRLVDLERMTLRDEGITGRNTPVVRRAFSNYDLTFLVHAAVEKNLAVADQWMDQLGLTTQSVMSARHGRRW
jgi:hypothetical protein